MTTTSRPRLVATRARRAGAAALVLVLACLASVAEAHKVNLSTARIELRPARVVALEVALKGSDVDRAVGTSLYDGATDRVDTAEVAAGAGPIADYILDNVSVAGTDGTACRRADPQVVPDGDGVVVRIAYDCGQVTGDLVYRSTVLTAVEPSARQIVLIGTGADSQQTLLDPTHQAVTITAPAPDLWTTLQRYTMSGIEHIFLGYDHIAFLIAVVLWATRVWPVVKAVTAFTIAHSITLSLAVLGIVEIPSAIVEAAIAASILFVAVENFFSRNVGRRWMITFPFGLIHGLGFASALKEYGLPQDAVAPALAAFNVGVEIGQIAIVMIVVPGLLGLDRLLSTNRAAPIRPRPLVLSLSGGIAVLAFRWLLLRTVMV
jgi:hydrogenase/urease accessory protein HupE